MKVTKPILTEELKRVMPRSTLRFAQGFIENSTRLYGMVHLFEQFLSALKSLENSEVNSMLSTFEMEMLKLVNPEKLPELLFRAREHGRVSYIETDEEEPRCLPQ